MRVLLLSQFFPPVIGGEERHVRALGLELQRRGHDVVVGTVAVPGTQVGTDVVDGLQVHRLKSSTSRLSGLYSEDARPHLPPLPDPELTYGLLQLRRQFAPDVVHAHNWIVNSWLAVPGRGRLPLVLTLHDYSDRCATKRLMLDGQICGGPAPGRCVRHAAEHYGGLKGLLTAGAVAAAVPVRRRSVDRYLVVSQAVADGNGLPAAGVPYEVVPNVVPDVALTGAQARVRPSFAPDEPYLFFAGDLSSEKGLLTLLSAYSRLGSAAPPLLCAGRPTPDTPDVLPPGVTVVQNLAHEDVLAAFGHALVAVLPSQWPDPCPTTVLEAMASGVPVVTCATGGMVDMVEHEVSGLLVPPADAEALAAALVRLLGDAPLRSRLSEQGQAVVRARFTVSTVAERVEAVYAELVQVP